MERPQFARLVVRCLVGLLALALVTPAAAARPTREVITVHDDFTVDSCGFPVRVQVDGKIAWITFYDANENVIRGIQLFPGAIQTLTNLNTGTSIRLPVTGPAFFDETGAWTTTTGQSTWLDTNPLTGEAGIFRTNGRLTFFDTGAVRLNGRIDNLCTALAH